MADSTPSPTRRRSRWLLGAVSIAAALSLAEYALRVFECRRCNVDDFALVRERYLGNRLAIFPSDDSRRSNIKDRLVPGQSIGDSIRINSLGFRGEELALAKPAGALRIVCLGGSSVFGTSCSSDATTWPALLQRILRRDGARSVEVVNGGVPSFRSAESVKRFELSCLELEPDVAILCNVHNDLLHRRLFRLSYDPRNDAPVPIENALERALSHSALYLRLRAFATYRAKQESLAGAVAAADQPLPMGRGWHKKSAEQEEALAEEQRSAQGGVEYFAARDLEDYRANLLRFIELARANGCTPVLATEILSFSLDAGAAAYAAEGSPVLTSYMPSYPAFRRAYEAYLGVLSDVAQAEGVLLLDAERELSRDTGLFTDHVHFTDQGCAEVAAIFARRLVEAGVVTPGR